jgi:hypothetical protein
MNQIEHIIEHVIEPKKLLLVWQSQGVDQKHTRRVVAEITRESNVAILRYLSNSTDYKEAIKEGFGGYPAFDVKECEHRQGVLDAFMRRLPPRNREDFGEYLTRHRLPDNAAISEMALLAYTGAKLPGDGFEICADFEFAQPPFEVILEVAGFRHQSAIPAKDMIVGSRVNLIPEPQNLYDPYAIALFYENNKIGYVGRTFTHAVHTWFEKEYEVEAVVERINGKPERPLVYLYVTVR